MAKYELIFSVEKIGLSPELGLPGSKPLGFPDLGSGATQTVMPNQAFNLAEYARISGIPEAEFSAESIEKVRHACSGRTEPAVVSVNHRPLA